MMTMTPIEKAAHEEYEYYGSTLTTNTALKAALVILSAAILMCAVQMRKMASAVANVKPLIIRVNEVGRAEAVAYTSFTYKPQAPEIRYFLTQFVIGYYGRNHASVRERYVASMYFLDRQLFSAIDNVDRKTQWLPKFVASSDEDVEISVNNVILENLNEPPYRARVEFTKIFTGATGTESHRERWTAVFDFKFNPDVPNDLIQHNPLGLAILYFRQDQAFTN